MKQIGGREFEHSTQPLAFSLIRNLLAIHNFPTDSTTTQFKDTYLQPANKKCRRLSSRDSSGNRAPHPCHYINHRTSDMTSSSAQHQHEGSGIMGPAFFWALLRSFPRQLAKTCIRGIAVLYPGLDGDRRNPWFVRRFRGDVTESCRQTLDGRSSNEWMMVKGEVGDLTVMRKGWIYVLH